MDIVFFSVAMYINFIGDSGPEAVENHCILLTLWLS